MKRSINSGRGAFWKKPAFWERLTGIGVGLGIVMLMQPFWKWAYAHGFVVLLIATAGYVVASHFPQAPEGDYGDDRS